MARRLRQSLFLVLGLLVTACGGGSQHSAAVIGSSNVPASATARLTLTIPAAGIRSNSAHSRAPLYISPNTAQAVVIVNSGSPQTYSLSPTGPNCQSVTGGTACNLAVTAPVGASDSFQIELEDSSSNVLSAGTFTTAIAEGTSNVTVPLVLGGVPKTLDITSAGSLGTFFTIGGGAQTSTLLTTVKDAHGDILIGNEPFVNASGAATPISITSANGATIKYASAPFGGSFGAPAGTFAMSAPSDTLEMAFSGSGVPPGYDTLTYAAGVTSATYGNNTPFIGIGVVWQAPFVPLSIAPIAADVAGVSGVPHSAAVTDGVNKLAVVGGSSCTVPNLPATVTAIPSIAIDAGASSADGELYTIVNAAASPETDFANYSLASINSGTCSQTNATIYTGTSAVGGAVRAVSGDIVYFVTNQTGVGNPQLEQATSIAPTTLVGGAVINYPVGGLALRGTHVFTCQNNSSGNIIITQYERPISASPTISSGPAAADIGTGQTGSCAGIAVDGSDGRLVFADTGSNVATRSATFPISAQYPMNMTGTTIVGSQTTDFQSAATGNWHQAEAFFVSASDGIEIFNQNPTITQQGIINLANSGLSGAITAGTVEAIAYGDDLRVWITLSSGYVVALPTY
jgi:hypothetical protein